MAGNTDPRAIKALRFVRIVRDLEPKLPAQTLEALLRIYSIVEVRSEPLPTWELVESLAPTAATTASRAVDWLKDAGLVRSRRSPEDGRILLLEMTPKGRTLVQEMLDTLD